jgi:hypothetical protein
MSGFDSLALAFKGVSFCVSGRPVTLGSLVTRKNKNLRQ